MGLCRYPECEAVRSRAERCESGLGLAGAVRASGRQAEVAVEQGFDCSSRVLAAGCEMAEAEGFEPPMPFDMPVFKTGAFSRSATPPSGGV